MDKECAKILGLRAHLGREWHFALQMHVHGVNIKQMGPFREQKLKKGKFI
jgi:hypothetical protein